jgi:glutaredoxin
LVRVTIYTKTGCHLCETAVRQVEAVRGRIAFELEKIDIRSDPALMIEYGFDIPVVEINGKSQFTHFLNEEQFESRLKEFTTQNEN